MLTIKDDLGTDHQYEITPHPPMDGLTVAAKLARILGPSICRFIGDLSHGVADALERDISGDQLSAAVEGLTLRLVTDDTPGLVQAILRFTLRDGQPLANPSAFAMAYAGNYGELAEALKAVITSNGFHRFLVRLAPMVAGKL